MDFVAGNLEVEVKEYKASRTDPNVIYYCIHIKKADGQTVIIEKRFSEFDDLNKRMKRLFGNLPVMPSKGFGKLKDPSQLEKRREDLDIYFKQMLARRDVFNNDFMRKFIQIQNYAPETVLITK